MNVFRLCCWGLGVLVLGNPTAWCAAPPLVSYQGFVRLNDTPFTGNGQFKFVLLDFATGATLWSNDGSSLNGSEPVRAVSLPVGAGLFTVLLGDTTLANMRALDGSVFGAAADARMRVWFSDGASPFKPLAPEQRVASVPYSLVADVPPQSVKAAQLKTAGAPAVGQILTFDGSGLAWTSPAGAGALSLPFSGGGGTGGAMLRIDNNGSGDAWAIFGRSEKSIGVFGQTQGDAAGVLGRNEGPLGQAVFGYASDAATGVLGLSEYGDGIVGVAKQGHRNGVVGRNDEPLADRNHIDLDGGSGVFGYASQDAIGVQGVSEKGDGVVGRTNGKNHNAVAGYTADPSSRAASFTHAAGGLALRTEGASEFGGRVQNDGVTLLRDHSFAFDHNLFLRGEGDPNHGIGWHGAGKPWSGVEYDGPVVWGYAGGALGSTRAGQKTALSWNTDDVQVSRDLRVTRDVDCRAITIRGGADLAEPFPISGHDVPAGAVVVIDEANPGRLKLSAEPYDTRVAGVVSGAGGIRPGISLIQEDALEPGRNVALTGRVYVQADATSAAIRPGDLLTTSANPGHAMRVQDHGRAQGAVLGKAMTGLAEGKGLVLVLVTLQ